MVWTLGFVSFILHSQQSYKTLEGKNPKKIITEYGLFNIIASFPSKDALISAALIKLDVLNVQALRHYYKILGNRL